VVVANALAASAVQKNDHMWPERPPPVRLRKNHESDKTVPKTTGPKPLKHIQGQDQRAVFRAAQPGHIGGPGVAASGQAGVHPGECQTDPQPEGKEAVK
jgi:hypothetical protein